MTTKIKVLNIIGTRPEAVKMAPIIKAMESDSAFECTTCATAQHRELLDQVLNLFQIKPDIDLDLMKPDQSLSVLTSQILTNLDPVITQLKPDWILAQGDTTTVMTAALLAYYNRINFGHVEAGLRTFKNFEPYPEEGNRRIAGTIATAHFAPTETAKNNLLRENVSSESIFITGNTVIDAIQSVGTLPIPTELLTLKSEIGPKKIILVTAHRRENFGEPIRSICTAIATLAQEFKNEIHFVYPVHPNPNVKEVATKLLKDVPNVSLLQPLDYLPMVHLIKESYLVLTDSGGLQEEAPGFGKPVLVMRNVTERPEGIQAGTVRLVGTKSRQIEEMVKKLLVDHDDYLSMAQAVNPYGDGKASARIIEVIKNFT
ncbi:MAG TPA: UDP-N-acetylglucosamine 2-epimerase (non-hydrolyzing) [Anaerolineales bacterium]|nr:UDP-N-acetylglucosamine 2-epimerase (non-hydrolyzing) [Anaerolineales bacterium]